MQRYPQGSLVSPQKTLLIWLGLVALAAVSVVAHPKLVVESTKDWMRIAPEVALAILIVAFGLLRSWQAAAGTLLVTLFSNVVAAGVTTLFGAPVTLLQILFLSPLAVQASAMFVFAHRDRVRRERQLSRPLPRDIRYIVSEAIRDVRGGVAIATFTTAILFYGIFRLDDLGWLGGYMIVGTFATSYGARTIIPALYAMFPLEVGEVPKSDRIARFATTSNKLVAALVVALLVGSLAVVATAKFPHGTEPIFTSMAIVAVIATIIAGIGLGSAKLAVLWLIATAAAVFAGLAVGILGGHTHDAMMPFALSLPIVAGPIARGIQAWNTTQKRPGHDGTSAAIEMSRGPGTGMLPAAGLGIAVMAVLFQDKELYWTAIPMIAALAAGALVGVAGLPALLSLLPHVAKKPVAEEDADKMKFHKVTADEKRKTFAQYSEDEIMNMNTADFLALAGKTVIRHGGSHGTRRMLVELDMPANAKVLELGAGVGATAFDLVHFDPTVHVTGVDLSAFMVDRSKEYAQERGLEKRIEFVHTREPNKLPFEDASFDAVIIESVAMYNDAPKFFGEVFRVLKPGGRLGLHDWCWVEAPTAQMEVNTCVFACGCNPGDVRFFTQADWEHNLTQEKFEIRYGQQYPFTFFSWSTMQDDEGLWRLIRMFGRVMARMITMKRMYQMTTFLARHEGTFGYTVTIAQKPGASA